MKNLKLYLFAALILIASAVVFTSCEEEKPEHYVSLRISLNRAEFTVIAGNSEALIATVLPAHLAVGQTVTWESSDESIATVDIFGRVTAIEEGKAVITARVADRWTTSVVTVLASQPTTDPGVVINGVTWATRNVYAPGTFTFTPTEPGMLYQWNRNVGWNTEDPIQNSDGGTTWDATVPEGTTWERENDPSPPGWRVPNITELESLFDTGAVSRVFETVEGMPGITFTDIATGNTLFLPASGNRVANGGMEALGAWTVFWSSTSSSNTYAHGLGFWTPGGGGLMPITEPYQRVFAHPIRSVKE